jgi:hypothetical protein
MISVALAAQGEVRVFVGQKLRDKPCRNEALYGNPE